MKALLLLLHSLFAVTLAFGESREYTAFDLFSGDTFKGIVPVYYSGNKVEIESPQEAAALILGKSSKPNTDLLPLLTGIIDIKRIDQKIGSVTADANTFRLVVRLNEEFYDLVNLNNHDLIATSEDRFSLRTDLQLFKVKNSGSSGHTAIGLNDIAFPGGWFRTSWTIADIEDSDNEDDTTEIREGSLNKIWGRWILSGGLLESAGAELVPSTFFAGLTFRTEPLLYRSSDSLRGNSFHIYVPTRSIVEFSRDGILIDRQVLEAGRREVDTTRFPQGGYYIDIVVREFSGGERKERKFFSKSGFLTTRGAPQFRLDLGQLREREDILDIPYYRTGAEWRILNPLQLNLSSFGTDNKQNYVFGLRSSYDDFLFTAAVSYSSENQYGYAIGGGGSILGTSISADYEKSELLPIDELELETRLGRPVDPLDTFLRPVILREGERRSIYISRWFEDLELRFTGLEIKRDNEPTYTAYGPTARYRFIESPSHTLALEVGQQHIDDDITRVGFLSWQYRFSPWSLDSTIGAREQKDNIGPYTRESLQYDRRNGRTGRGLRGRIDVYTQEDLEGNEQYGTSLQSEFGGSRGGILALASKDKNNTTNYGFGANIGFVLDNDGNLTTGPSGLGDALLAVNIVSSSSEALTDLIVDGSKVHTIKGSQELLVGLSPYQRYAVRIRPSEKSPVVDYDSSVHEIILYPGHTQRIEFNLTKVFVALGIIYDTAGNPLRLKRIQGTRESVLTDETGTFQTELIGSERLTIGEPPCEVALPQLPKLPEYFHDYGSLTCS